MDTAQSDARAPNLDLFCLTAENGAKLLEMTKTRLLPKRRDFESLNDDAKYAIAASCRLNTYRKPWPRL